HGRIIDDMHERILPDAMPKLELIRHSRQADYHPPKATDNFTALVNASRAFERSNDRTIEQWFKLLSSYDFKYKDLVTLEEKALGHPLLKGPIERGKTGWRDVASLFRSVLGRLGDRIVAAQPRKGIRQRTTR